MSASPQKSEGKAIRPATTDEEIQKVAEIKDYLETKISDLESELEKLRGMLVLVDTTLREKSFIPAIALRSTAVASPIRTAPQKGPQNTGGVKTAEAVVPRGNEPSRENQLNANHRQLRRTKDSMILGEAFIDEQKVVIIPSKEIKLSQHTPPFESFFVNRILRGFQSKDEEEAKNGKLKPNGVLQYNVVETEGSISSVTIFNYRDTARLNEILSTVTWAFTRMLEKK